MENAQQRNRNTEEEAVEIVRYLHGALPPDRMRQIERRIGEDDEFAAKVDLTLVVVGRPSQVPDATTKAGPANRVKAWLGQILAAASRLLGGGR